MTMNYYILDTIEDFNECQSACYTVFMATVDSNTAYALQTTAWAEPQQRLTDNKYICPECSEYTNTANYTIEQSQTNWFPETGL